MTVLTIKDTATPHGISKIDEIAWRCPRKVWYQIREDKRREDNPESHSKLYPKPVKKALLTGTIGHAILAHYYSGNSIENISIESSDYRPQDLDDCTQIAMRACRQYVMRHKPNEFGRVLAIEKRVDTSLFNVPYSFRPDLVVRVTRTKAKELQKTRRIDIVPGNWIIDHKFVASTSGNLYQQYINSNQVSAYQLGWNSVHPKKQRVEGVILNLITKTKDTSILSGVVFGVDKIREMVLQNTFSRAKMFGFPIWNGSPMPFANPKCCFNVYGTCSYYSSGECPRF